MDFWILLALMALAIPVCAVAGFTIALRGRGRLDILERRIETLEREIARRPQPAAEPDAPAVLPRDPRRRRTRLLAPRPAPHDNVAEIR